MNSEQEIHPNGKEMSLSYKHPLLAHSSVCKGQSPLGMAPATHGKPSSENWRNGLNFHSTVENGTKCMNSPLAPNSDSRPYL